MSWSNDLNRGFTADEPSGLKRSPEVLAGDIDGFLSTIASYLPFDYIAEKLITQSTDMLSVWTILYELYDAEISTSHYLDYAMMTKFPEETYRNFHNRLVGFVRQHLPTETVTADGISSPATGETLTIGLLDAITVHWLMAIDKRLISIIKTEFAPQLKTHRLCQLVKTIATNIDDLLTRYNFKDSEASISQMSSRSQTYEPLATPKNDTVDMIIRRLEKLEDRQPPKFRKKKANKFKNSQFCSHCAFINKQLGANLDTSHSNHSCTKRKISINVLDVPDQDTTSDESDCYEGEQSSEKVALTNDSLQTDPRQLEETRLINCVESLPLNSKARIHESGHYSSSISECKIDSHLNSSTNDICTHLHQVGKCPEIRTSQDPFSAALLKLSSSSYPWEAVTKSESPRISCKLINQDIDALIDTGAEVSALDENAAITAGIGISETKETAQAANKLPLDIRGQSSSPVTLSCQTQEGVKMINLGFVWIIRGLGVACLIGEPGIANNNIICLPRKKIVLLAGNSDIHHVPYLINKQQYSLARAVETTTISPSCHIDYKLPPTMMNVSHVLITPRKQSVTWLNPGIFEVSNGCVKLVNSSPNIVNLKKSDHIADIRSTSVFVNNLKLPVSKYKHEDGFQFKDLAQSRQYSKDYLAMLKVDPDGILSQMDRDLFHQLHRRYAHLFTPQPGKYNGAHGYVDNKLKFSTPPPPNARTYIPNYSPSMNKLLAEKMDLLEEWGVLSTPEAVGVSVDFVSPSMLVPKTDSKDFRMVTDFASLNLYLKRVPNTSATIAQAKSRIARAKYVVHMDLSNYFYQMGLQKEDIRYLGTVHPFKGLRVYTVDPQGLKGASERSYEKLLRIFGDMIQNGQLAQMADGLHVLGDSIAQLVSNYEEVLCRSDACNLTFKPSKVTVCPKNICLFGWSLKGQTWLPTSHTTSSLVNAALPTTIKQLRSFLGSFKQLSPCMPNYASTVHILEQLTSNKKSAERITWTDPLRQAFQNAKDLAANPIGIAEPRPDDHLQTYSDYAADTRAVGGRLLILRKLENGDTIELPGGFFNAILDSHKANWLPCEGEAAGIRLVLEHFKNHIRESNNPTVHFTDSQPCVLAWKRSQRGAFSTSARISTFLTGLSAMPIELRHKSGKLMHTSDFASRHPSSCSSQRCQICSFVREWENLGDRATEIRSITIDDIQSGRSLMPMTQKMTWKGIQARDPVHMKLKQLIETQQLPESRKTKGDHTKVKLLHNQYTQGKLYVDQDDVIMLKSPDGKFNGSVISIPPSLYPGITNALHIQLGHPSKAQLSALMSRYFYTPGGKSIIDDVSDNCHQCATVRKLPKVLLEDTTTPSQGLCSKFSVDVIERCNQKILVVREDLSQFVRAKLIENQTATTLRDSILQLIIDILPEGGTEIRTDGATGFQALQSEANSQSSIFNKLKVRVTIGRLLNKNKNPTAEIAVKELQKEILRHTTTPRTITPTDLAIIVRNYNSRIRHNGYTPKEIMFRRDIASNSPIEIEDKELIHKQLANRKESSKNSSKFKSKNSSPTPNQTFQIGDLVFVRDNHDKINPCQLHIVEATED